VWYVDHNTLEDLMERDTVFNMCKIGQGNDCCRYLCVGKSGLECAKLTEAKPLIDKRVEDGAFIACGDNCIGIESSNSDEHVEWLSNKL